MHRNFKMISRIVFGRGSFSQLGEILRPFRKDPADFFVYIIDHVFCAHPLWDRLPLDGRDLPLAVDTTDEPSTWQVDDLTAAVRGHADRLPAGVIGIGGGSAMDLAKAVSLLLTNTGTAADYQGWDLIRNPAVYHMAVPTLAGTGAEVSRTAVLIGPEKKLGINSDHTVFDQVLLDPELLAGVPLDQRFYTGMDCYIHCVESLNGTFLNAFSKGYGEKAMALCRDVFLPKKNHPPEDAGDLLMMASYFGGMSIAYSQVGVCHALSYGLSFILKIHHGPGNCIAFNQLEAYYPEGVREFHEMLDLHGISLPVRVTRGMSDKEMERMARVALGLAPLWENALGPDWEQKITLDDIITLYQRM